LGFGVQSTGDSQPAGQRGMSHEDTLGAISPIGRLPSRSTKLKVTTAKPRFDGTPYAHKFSLISWRMIQNTTARVLESLIRDQWTHPPSPPSPIEERAQVISIHRVPSPGDAEPYRLQASGPTDMLRAQTTTLLAS
jgi:hypothetical protein